MFGPQYFSHTGILIIEEGIVDAAQPYNKSNPLNIYTLRKLTEFSYLKSLHVCRSIYRQAPITTTEFENVLLLYRYGWRELVILKNLQLS